MIYRQSRLDQPSQTPRPTHCRARTYNDVKVGLLGAKLEGVASVDGDGLETNLARGCLADSLAALEVVPNPDQRAPADWSDDSGNDSDDSDPGEE